MKFLIVAIFACFVGSEAFLFSGLTWDDLKVTWGPNLLNWQYFDAMPRTVPDAVAAGWVLEKSCSQVNGNRYILDGDRSILLIFNSAGYIAGIASAIPKGLAYNYPSAKQAQYMQDEGADFTLNAYFQDPTTVCTMAKPSVMESSFETGDRVVIVGDGKSLNIPINEDDVVSQSKFSKGGCFPTMGRHYYSHVDNIEFDENIKPEETHPIFFLYNNGKLNAFGWILNANVDGPRWEHAPKSSASVFLPAVPKFLNDPSANQLLSSIHIFLDSTPYSNFC